MQVDEKLASSGRKAILVELTRVLVSDLVKARGKGQNVHRTRGWSVRHARVAVFGFMNAKGWKYCRTGTDSVDTTTR